MLKRNLLKLRTIFIGQKSVTFTNLLVKTANQNKKFVEEQKQVLNEIEHKIEKKTASECRYKSLV